jgi:hypothetical protein
LLRTEKDKINDLRIFRKILKTLLLLPRAFFCIGPVCFLRNLFCPLKVAKKQEGAKV